MTNFITRIGDGLSMKVKLVIGFILLAALPVIFTTIATSYLSNQALMDLLYANNQRTAVSLASEINEMIEAKIKALKVAANSQELQSMDVARQLPMLWSVNKQYPEMQLIVSDSLGTQTVRTEGKLANVSDRAYFQQVKNGALFSVSDVLVAKGIGKSSVMICVPIKDELDTLKGTIIGVIDLAALSRTIGETKIGQSGYAFLVDRMGKIIAHPNPALVTEQTDLSSLEAVKEAIGGKSGVAVYNYEGTKKMAGYSHVPLAGWGIIAQQPHDEAIAGATKVLWTGVGLTLAAILLAVVVAVLAAGVFTRPVRDLVTASERIAQGDLTTRASVTTKDELGQLAAAFNAMVDNLQHLIRAVTSIAEQVAASSQELAATSNEAEKAVSQIASTMTEFAEGSQQQALEMDRTLQVVDQLKDMSQAVAEKAQAASALSAEMASAAESGGGAARNAVDKMNEIKDVTAATAEVVSALGEKSKQIGQILDVISGIAGQTNLLALNAAIEAARAGEQGRGFAVVADEVRKLAEQSQVATQHIANIVREIQNQTDEAIRAMDSGSGKVNEGVDVVQTAGRALQNILDKITSSVSVIGDINAASNQQRRSMQDMVSSAGYVAAIARQSSAGVQSTAAASEQVTGSIGDIASAADALAKMAGELQAMVSKFKI